MQQPAQRTPLDVAPAQAAEEGSTHGASSSAGRHSTLPVSAALPVNHADASLIPSVMHSPTQSCVAVNATNAVFSRHVSQDNLTGSIGGDPADASAKRTTAATDGADEALPDEAVVKVNTLPAIIGYFGMMFGEGICVFYSPIFHEKGFAAYEIGMLVAVYPLLSMTLLPMLSYWADKFRCETKMMMSCIVVASAMTFAFTLVSFRPLVIVYFLILTASRIAMNPLLDQRTLMMFPKQGRSSAWSHVRSYGAYGWGIGSLVASALYTVTHSWIAVACQFLVGQFGLAYCMLTTKPYEAIEIEEVHFKEVLHLLATNKRVMLFLFAATMMGTGYCFIENFLFLFLEELGGSKLLMGFTVVLTVSTEIPLFQKSERLHQMFSERQMIAMAMGVWTFRVLCYSQLQNAWYVLLIEPLHGFTFAFMWLPAVHLIARAFPPKLSSSATGVLFTFTSGVGPMIGNLIAGTLYSLIGPRKMFLSAAAAMAAALVFYLSMDMMLERRGVPIVIDYDAADDSDVAVVEAATGAEGSAEKDKTTLCATAVVEPSASPRRAREDAKDAEIDNGGRQRELDVVNDELPH